MKISDMIFFLVDSVVKDVISPIYCKRKPKSKRKEYSMPHPFYESVQDEIQPLKDEVKRLQENVSCDQAAIRDLNDEIDQLEGQLCDIGLTPKIKANMKANGVHLRNKWSSQEVFVKYEHLPTLIQSLRELNQEGQVSVEFI